MTPASVEGSGAVPLRDVPTNVKYEFRGVFVTTAYNLDWPSRPGLHWRAQRDEINAIVERVAAMKCNVVILQVRAFGDRIHRHTAFNEPWAEPLNHRQDPHPRKKAEERKYDPLAEWIAACHAKGIELHVWINPFRVNGLVDKLDVRKTKEETYLWLTPESLSVHEHVVKVVKELINYKKKFVMPRAMGADDADSMMQKMADSGDGGPDGVLIDHNLPPEPPRKTTQPAAASAATTAATTTEEDDTALGRKKKRIKHLLKKRYPNDEGPQEVNTDLEKFIARLKNECEKGGVKFGISPLKEDSTAMEWMEKRYAHYFVPELYMRMQTGPEQVQFKSRLGDWLNSNTGVGHRPVIVAGLYTIRVQSPDGEKNDPWNKDEIKTQITEARVLRGSTPATTQNVALGQAHYSWSALRSPGHGGPDSSNSIGDDLANPQNSLYLEPALLPRMRDGAAPGQPTVNRTGDVVSWSIPGSNAEDNVRFWAVWERTSSGWGPVSVYPKQKKDHTVGSGVTRVAVKAIDMFNRDSDFGTHPNP